jgi:hypothetical protein
MSSSIQIFVKPSQNLRAEFARTLKVRINEFLTIDAAKSLLDAINRLPSFHIATASQGRPYQLSEQEWKVMPSSQRSRFLELVYSQAAQGQGYFYRRYKPTHNCTTFRSVLD